MDLATSQRQLRELEHYIDLSSRLEGMVDESIRPLVRETNDYLAESLLSYREIVALRMQALRKRTHAEGVYVGSVYEIARKSNLRVEDIEKMFEEDNKKSDNALRLEYTLKIAKNTILSVFSAPFSRKKSSDYADCIRSYCSALKSLNQTVKIKKETSQIKQRNLIKTAEHEKKEAEVYSGLVSAGYDEAVAESIVLEGNAFFYELLDSLKDHYGLE